MLVPAARARTVATSLNLLDDMTPLLRVAQSDLLTDLTKSFSPKCHRCDAMYVSDTPITFSYIRLHMLSCQQREAVEHYLCFCGLYFIDENQYKSHYATCQQTIEVTRVISA